MGKYYIRLLLVLLGMGFCIFFGVDLATRGVEQIQGPLVKAGAEPGNARIWQQAGDKLQGAKSGSGVQVQNGSKANGPEGSSGTASAAEAKSDSGQEEDVEPKSEIDGPTGIARVGNKAGELLQIMAYHGIRLFVWLFDLVTG